MIEFLKQLLSLLTTHPEILPNLWRLITHVSSADDKMAAVRAAEAAAAKAAIRS